MVTNASQFMVATEEEVESLVSSLSSKTYTTGPENTMYNYRRCVLEYQTGLLEIDFRLTKDNEVVLIHNATVGRLLVSNCSLFLDDTTDGRGLVSSFTLEELKKLDAAYNYPSLRGQGITIPTFKEFLGAALIILSDIPEEFLPFPNLVFMLDFKDEDSINRTMEMIKEHDLWDRIILGAVPPTCNALLAQLKPPQTPLATDASTTTKLTLAHYSGMG